MQTDYHLLKRNTLLNLINHLGPISRKKLTEYTDYRPASISELTKELIDDQLVVERGSLSTGPGRRRVLLELNSARLCAVGVLLSFNHVSYVLSQTDGVIVERVDTDITDSPDDRLADIIVEKIMGLIKAHPERYVVGIGLADPLFDEAHFGFATTLPKIYDRFIDWGHMELKSKLEKMVDIPVKNFSAMMLPALVEQHYGTAKGKQDFICVEISNGLGMSIMCNGEVVKGFQGRAGEFGHTTINFGAENRSMCYCGKTGCVEADAAFPYIRKNISEALKNGAYSALLDFHDPDKPLTVQDVRRGLDMGDILCEHYVRESARRIGAAIANIVNVLNPESVVLYGSLTQLGDFFINEIKSILRRNTLVYLRDYQVVVNEEMESLLPLGAAAQMFNEFLNVDSYSWIYKLQPEGEADLEDTEE
ncbi:MAG: ROK family transcriptional regulator [Eubacteriales bacterium]|nr:ROK family transcriptional regulator [Eubacteriales bacterium]